LTRVDGLILLSLLAWYFWILLRKPKNAAVEAAGPSKEEEDSIFHLLQNLILHFKQFVSLLKTVLQSDIIFIQHILFGKKVVLVFVEVGFENLVR